MKKIAIFCGSSHSKDPMVEREVKKIMHDFFIK